MCAAYTIYTTCTTFPQEVCIDQHHSRYRMPPKKRGKGNPNATGRPRTINLEGVGHDVRNEYKKEMKKPVQDRYSNIEQCSVM